MENQLIGILGMNKANDLAMKASLYEKVASVAEYTGESIGKIVNDMAIASGANLSQVKVASASEIKSSEDFIKIANAFGTEGAEALFNIDIDVDLMKVASGLSTVELTKNVDMLINEMVAEEQSMKSKIANARLGLVEAGYSKAEAEDVLGSILG